MGGSSWAKLVKIPSTNLSELGIDIMKTSQKKNRCEANCPHSDSFKNMYIKKIQQYFLLILHLNTTYYKNDTLFGRTMHTNGKRLDAGTCKPILSIQSIIF